MFKTFIYIVICITCFQSHAQLKISGKTKLPDGTAVFIFKTINQEPLLLANSVIYDNKFEIEIPIITENEILFFKLDNIRYSEIQFISENYDLIYIENEMMISGGVENKIRYEFYKKTDNNILNINRTVFKNSLNNYFKKNSDEIENDYIFQKSLNSKKNKYYEIIKNTISENPNAFYSYTLLENLYNQNLLTIEEIIEYKNILYQNFKYKPLIKKFEKEIDDNKTYLLGETIPNYVFFDINDHKIELKEILDNVTLIDFWSTNCQTCRLENKNLEKIYNKFNKKGFKIIRINVDTNNDLISKLVKDHPKNWINVSKINPNNSNLNLIFESPKTPSSFLIDSTGKIIAKDLVDEELTDKINEVLKTK